MRAALVAAWTRGAGERAIERGLFKVLTGKRWELLKALTGAGPVTIREAARRVARDVKSVHGDVHALLKVGIHDERAHRAEPSSIRLS